MLRTLLASGTSPDALDEYGRTPLMTAAEWGSTAAVDLLLEKGASVATKDPYGDDALLAATRSGAHPATGALPA